jgi:hypothetical protein
VKAVSTAATKVLAALIDGLEPIGDEGEARHVGEEGQAYMRVTVERLSAATFSVAHYFEQQGDLMRDPEMVFLRGADGQFYPVSFRQDSTGTDEIGARLGRDDVVLGVDPRLQADHARFASTWMVNIRSQQAKWFEVLR